VNIREPLLIRVTALQQALFVEGGVFPDDFKRFVPDDPPPGYPVEVWFEHAGRPPRLNICLAEILRTDLVERQWFRVSALPEEGTWRPGDQVEVWPVLTLTGHICFYGRRVGSSAPAVKLARRGQGRHVGRSPQWLALKCPEFVSALREAGGWLGDASEELQLTGDDKLDGKDLFGGK
jgi:hypothetical protein